MRINQDICEMCSLCMWECEHDAVKHHVDWDAIDCLTPDYERFEIDAVLCVDCGDCVEVCPVGAIEEGV